MNFKEFSDYETGNPVIVNLNQVVYVHPCYDSEGEFVCCSMHLSNKTRILVTESYTLIKTLLGGGS